MREKNEAVERLLQVGIALSSIENLESLLDLILREAQELMGCDGASIFLVKEEKLIFKAMRSGTYFRMWGEEKTRAVFKAFEMPLTKNSIAGYVALTSSGLNIPDVSSIPAGEHYRYDPTLDEKYGYRTVSLLVIPIKNKQSKVIGVLELINAIVEEKVTQFSDADREIAESFSSQAGVAIQNTSLTEQLREANFDTIFRLSVAAEYRDKETSNHIKRVSYYARLIAEKLRICTEDCTLLFWAAPMHDIGKLGIPDSILQKPGPLTPEERKIMEKHPVIGAKVLKDSKVPVILKSKVVALTHHEKYDGTGYPLKMKGNAIPVEGRIVALADVFDALTSKRVYKAQMPEEQALKIMKEGRGVHFDPEMLDCFLGNLPAVREIRDRFEDKPEDFDKLKDVGNEDLSELLK